MRNAQVGVACTHCGRCFLGSRFVTTYAGPATLVLEDGSQFSVLVALHSSDVLGLKRWWGAVGTAHAPARWQEGESDPATLRLPDAQEGTVVPGTDALGGRVLQVTGSGPAPF
jgi:hypothetical protein